MKIRPFGATLRGRYQTASCCVGWRPLRWAMRKRARITASG